MPFLSQTDVDDGSLGRILIARTQHIPDLLDSVELDQSYLDNIKQWYKQIEDLVTLATTGCSFGGGKLLEMPVSITQEAKELISQQSKLYRDKQRELEANGQSGATTGRFREMVNKISMLLAINSQPKAPVVTLPMMELAIEIVAYCLTEWEEIFTNEIHQSVEDMISKKIITTLAAHPTYQKKNRDGTQATVVMTVGKLRSLTGKIPERDFEPALKSLVEDSTLMLKGKKVWFKDQGKTAEEVLGKLTD